MRVFLTADAHFFEWREYASVVDGVNTRLRAITDALIHSVGEAVNEHGCDAMFFLGDLTHSRSTLPHPVVSEVRRFSTYARNMFKYIVAIRGNHDVYLKSPSIDSISLLAEGSNVSVRGVPSSGKNSEFGYVPWMGDRDDFRRALDHFRAQKVEYVFGHFGVLGSTVGDSWVVNKAEVGVEDLEGFRGVFLGHYHKHQRIKGNAWYVGSPVPHTWGEADQEKVYGVLDTDKGKVTWHTIPGPTFRKVNLQAEELDSVMSTTNPDAFIRVTVNPDDKQQIRELEKLRKERPNLNVEYEREIKESAGRIDIGKTHKDAVVAFIKERPPTEALDKKKLVEAACSILGDKDVGAKTGVSKIRIKRIRLKHFMSFTASALNLDKRGLVCISGSNGAGKSALLESILWCLYGKTIRYGAATSNLINRFAEEPKTRVEVILDVDGHEVSIQRYAKTRTQDAKIVVNGYTYNYADGQAHADVYLPPYDVFVNTVFFSSSLSRFTEASDYDKKTIIENILGLTAYREAEEEAKRLMTKARLDSELASTTHANTAGSVAALVTAIEEHKAKKPKTTDRHEKEYEHAKDERARVRDALMQAETECEKAHKALQVAEGAARSAMEQQASLHELALQLQSDLRDARSEQAAIRARSKITSEFAAKIRSTRGTCPTCKQKVSMEYVKSAEADAKAAEADLAARHEEFEQIALGLQRRIIEVTEKEKALNEEAQDSPKLKKARERWALAASKRKTAVAHYETADDRYDAAKEEMTRYKAAFEAWQKHGRALSAQRDAASKKSEEAAAIVKSALAEMQLYTYITQMFSASGLRSYILDTCETDINREIQKVSKTLTGGSIDVRFSATSTTKGGNIKDRVSIVAINENGSEVYPGNSKGERARIDLCVLFGVRNLALKRAYIRFGTLFMDEVFDGVDPSGAQAVVQLLNDEASAGSTIPLVSHDPNIVGMVSDVITIQKDGNTSKIEEATGGEDDEGTPEPEPRKAKRRSRARG